MPSRSQRHLREIYGVDSRGGTFFPGTGIPPGISALLLEGRDANGNVYTSGYLLEGLDGRTDLPYDAGNFYLLESGTWQASTN